MSKFPAVGHLRALTLVALWIQLAFSATAWSQNQQRLSYTPSTAIEQEKSRAEGAAEELVSLSADQIVNILTQETAKEFLKSTSPEDMYKVRLHTPLPRCCRSARQRLHAPACARAC